MAIYADYTTLTDLRTNYLGTTSTAQDALLLDLIRSVSRSLDRFAARAFYPRIATLYFDVPSDRYLLFGDDLLELTTLTNGDGSVITSQEYDLLPYGYTPYYAVRLKSMSTVTWEDDADGNSERALSVAGIWGYHDQYAHAWPATGAILSAAIVDVAATSITCTTGKVNAGDLLKIDSEYLYASAVTVGGSDTVTVVRGVNGSTAATHLINTPIYRWWSPVIEQLTNEAVVAKFRIRTNPVGDTVRVGDYNFTTPRDVDTYIMGRLNDLGYGRPF